MKNALIISTYNWPDALALILQSVAKQSMMPNEVFIADDGSNQETKMLIEKSINQYSFPIFHIWQKDEGFRLAKIRNKAIAASKSDYLIFIDGDMILHPTCIASHIRFRKNNYYLQGSRVLLDKELTQSIINTAKLPRISFYSKQIRNRFNSLHLPIADAIFSHDDNHFDTVRGCHMSFWKKDLMRVNGFNEDFTSWGKEDNEIVSRLFNVGVKRKNLKLCAVAYHLYHNHHPTSMDTEKNERILRNTLDGKLKRCINGLIKKN